MSVYDIGRGRPTSRALPGPVPPEWASSRLNGDARAYSMTSVTAVDVLKHPPALSSSAFCPIPHGILPNIWTERGGVLRQS